jgi:hypothetical protein
LNRRQGNGAHRRIVLQNTGERLDDLVDVRVFGPEMLVGSAVSTFDPERPRGSL